MFLFWRSDLFGGGVKQEVIIRKDKAPLESAEEVKKTLEGENKKMQEQLQEQL